MRTTIKMFKENFIKLGPTENSLPADIRYTIYCTTIANGKDSDWTYLWNRYQNSHDSPSEKKDILRSLACTKEIWILQVFS